MQSTTMAVIMILHPDMLVEQPENATLVYANPIDEDDWHALYHAHARNEIEQVAMRYVIFKSDATTDVHFMRNDSETTDTCCILLRRMEDDDLCMEAVAWIRLKEDYHGMIYCVRPSKHETSMAQTAGADQASVAMVDFELPTIEDLL